MRLIVQHIPDMRGHFASMVRHCLDDQAKVTVGGAQITGRGVDYMEATICASYFRAASMAEVRTGWRNLH